MSTNFIRSFLTLVFTCTSVFAFAQRMSPQDFRNFSRPQQVEVIQSMQMFAVNIEKMHYQEVKRKYSYQTIRYLLESIVSKAIADEVIKNEKLCIYAGWISYIPKNSKKSLCAHPNSYRKSQVPEALKKVIAKEHERYEKFKGTFKKNECNNPGKIMCNPQLFGHSPGIKKPFCVDGNPNSENSSFQCLKKVETSQNKDKILSIIIKENLEYDNTERLQRLMSMIDDACMCESPNNMIDQKYAKRMYKTQTCFSWVAQVRNISKRACKLENEPDKDISSIIKLSQNLYSKAQNELMATGINDVEYTNIVEGGEWSNRNWKSRTEEYKDFCEKKKVYAISIIESEIKGIVIASPTLDGKPLKLDGYEIEWMKGDNPLKGKKEALKINVDPSEYPSKIHANLKKSGKDLSISNTVDLKKEDKEYEITIAEDEVTDDGQQKLKATVKIDGKEINEEELKNYKIVWFKKNNPKIAKDIKKDQPQKKDGDKKGPLTGKDGAKQDPPPQDASKNTVSFDESSETFITEKLKIPENDIEVHALLLQGEKELDDSNKLPFTKPVEAKKENKDDEKYNISIKKTSVKGTKQLIAATVTLNGKVVKASELADKGLEIIWFEKLAANDEIKKGSKKEEKKSKLKHDDFGSEIKESEKSANSKKEKVDTLGDKVAEKEENKKKDDETKDKDGFKKFAKSNKKLDTSSDILDKKKIVIAKLRTKENKLKKSNDVNFMKPKGRAISNQNNGGQLQQGLKRRVLHLNGVR